MKILLKKIKNKNILNTLFNTLIFHFDQFPNVNSIYKVKATLFYFCLICLIIEKALQIT